MVDPVVIAAVIGGVPATVGSFAAWRASRHVHDEVRTNHGLRQGDYVELTAMVVGELKEAFTAHVEVDKTSFDALTEGQRQIREEQARVAAALARKLGT